MLDKLIRSVLWQDTAPVVLCDLKDIIVYMNPAAVKNYSKYGGEKLLGQNLKDCHSKRSGEIIDRVVEWFGKSVENNIVHTEIDKEKNKDIYMVALRDEDGTLIGYYEKHECRNFDTTPLYEFMHAENK